MKLLRRFTGFALCLVWVGMTSNLQGQAKDPSDPGLLTLDRIFSSDDFKATPFGPVRWLKKQGGYTVKEPSQTIKGAHDIVHYQPTSPKGEVVVAARDLIPRGETKPLAIDNYTWSANEALVLIYTNSKRVWRQNTRGDYWVFDVSSRDLYQLGNKAPAASLMFAKFSPDSRKVAYVHDRDVYVQDLTTRKVVRITKRKTKTIINGTFDWVYEEELSLRDGIRWSPDSKKIAYWQLDTEGVGDYLLLSNTQGLYQRVRRFKYPKTGTRNAACFVLVADWAGQDQPRRMKVPGDPREHYIARMDWADNSSELVLQQLNRLQNTNKVMLADASTGEVKTVFVDRDKAWLDVHDALHWIHKGKAFTWMSERDGWRHLHVVSRSGDKMQTVTPGNFDVINLVHVDKKLGWVYFLASPENPTQKYLFRAKLDGSKIERLTPSTFAGTNTYKISPDSRWAIHTHSTFDKPAIIRLIQLPEHKEVRILVDNKKLHEAVKKLKRKPVEFFKVDIGDDVVLDGWCLKPADFDARKRYPVLFFVYGEPAGQTVADGWSSRGATRYLWHIMLTQKGYLVMSIDNRGTRVPRGRAWRKVVYRQIGSLASREQAAAVRAIQKKWSFVDPKRVGVWGWSGGGSMSLNAIFRYPDLYHTAMAIAPVSNQRYYDTIYQERYMGLPQDNVEGYRKGSPITYAHQLKGNLLLVHGAADDNVHYANSEVLINELIAHNKMFSMMAYPDRTHSIREGKNTRRHLFGLLTRFLHRHLPSGPR